jgi:hypothetical protein
MCLTVDGSIDPDNAWVPPAGAVGPGYITTPFGVTNTFWDVINVKPGRDGQPTWEYGEDAKRLIAMWPQSTASSIMKLAMLGVWVWPRDLDEALADPDFLIVHSKPNSQMGESLRLSIHDELLGMCQEYDTSLYLNLSRRIMERQWPQLPLSEPWARELNQPYLNIITEAKVGPVWGEMKEL